jgi:hypothetical protein
VRRYAELRIHDCPAEIPSSWLAPSILKLLVALAREDSGFVTCKYISRGSFERPFLMSAQMRFMNVPTAE